MNDVLAAPTVSSSPGATRVVAVIAGIFVLSAAAGYVVGAASRRLSSDGFQLDAVATIVVVTVLLVAFARDRVQAAVDRKAD